MEILTFRVESYDRSGNRLAPVPVELGGGLQLSGSRISGQVSDGDEVEVRGTWRGGILRAETIVNLSTGAHVQGRSGWQELTESISPDGRKRIRRGFVIALVAISAVIIAGISGIVISIRHTDSEFEKRREEAHTTWCLNIRDMGMDPPPQCDGVV